MYLLFDLDYLDLASQLKYLTPGGEPQLIDSPQLKRGSKVLSWISETEDLLFEDTGTEMNRDTKDGCKFEIYDTYLLFAIIVVCELLNYNE